MTFHRSLMYFLVSGHCLLIALAISPNASGAEDVIIRDKEGFAEMLGNSGWRPEPGSAPHASLLIDSPRQRQMSQWRRGKQRVTGFGLPGFTNGETRESEPVTEEPRGLSWSTSPTKMPSEQLTITGTYIQTAPADSPDGGKPSGLAGSVSVDSKLPAHGAVRLHGELAYSNFDADGSQDWFDEETGSAFAGALSYAPKLRGSTEIELDAGYREVGPGFRSVANPALADDQRRMHLGGRLKREGLSFQGEMSRTLENFSESDTPTLGTDSISVRAGYSPSSNGSKKDGFLFDNPRFNAGFSRSLTESMGEGTARPTAQANSTFNFSMAFAPGTAQWSLEHEISRQENSADFYLDHLNRKNRLTMAFPAGPQARLSSTLEQSRSKYENGYALDEISAAFRLSLTGKSGLRSSFSLVRKEKQSSNGSVDEACLSADVRVDKALPALPGDPNVWFGGNYATLASKNEDGDSHFKIFFGIELKLGTG